MCATCDTHSQQTKLLILPVFVSVSPHNFGMTNVNTSYGLIEMTGNFTTYGRGSEQSVGFGCPEIGPGARACGQLVYIGSDHRKHE